MKTFSSARYDYDARYLFVVAYGRCGREFFGAGSFGLGLAVTDDFGNLVAVEP